MKKNILAAMLSCIQASVSFAGTIGPDTLPLNTQLRPFVIGEGAYTWNNFDKIIINDLPSTKSENRWGGRLGAGFYRPLSEKYSFISEVGFGYFGKAKRIIPSAGYSLDTTVYGLDLLFGASYHFSVFDISFKAGGMFEDEIAHSYNDLSQLSSGDVISGVRAVKLSKLELFPEIKAGILYNIIDQVSLTLSYMHVFGHNDSSRLNLDATLRNFSYNQSSNYNNVTLDSIMFGVQYTFV